MKNLICFIFGHKIISRRNQHGFFSKCKRCRSKFYISYKEVAKLIGEPFIQREKYFSITDEILKLNLK